MDITVKVIDNIENQVLFTCGPEDLEKAYSFAKEMEEMGLDVRVQAPHIHDTLANTLGVSEDQQADYQESMEQELADHDHDNSSCCFKND